MGLYEWKKLDLIFRWNKAFLFDITVFKKYNIVQNYNDLIVI